jgi:hypothetical protein
VCGFIALYLHLAELARFSSHTQPLDSLMAGAQLTAWPYALLGGHIMAAALTIHQALHEAETNNTTSSSSPSTSSESSSSTPRSFSEVDTQAHALYQAARRLVCLSAELEPGSQSVELQGQGALPPKEALKHLAKVSGGNSRGTQQHVMGMVSRHMP